MIIFKSMSLNSFILGAFAIVTTGVIAFTAYRVQPRIDEQIRQAREKALFQVLSADSHDNDLLATIIALDPQQTPHIELLGLRKTDNAHIGRQGNKAVAVILPAVAPDGYSGDIVLMVGIDVDGNITGVRITEHRETPGLGDKVDRKRSDWVLNFDDKSLYNPNTQGWHVKKDQGQFDQFTGATITPRAVVKAVHKALLFFEHNRVWLLDENTANTTINHNSINKIHKGA